MDSNANGRAVGRNGRAVGNNGRAVGNNGRAVDSNVALCSDGNVGMKCNDRSESHLSQMKNTRMEVTVMRMRKRIAHKVY